jgi:hypothetical protein
MTYSWLLRRNDDESQAAAIAIVIAGLHPAIS